MSGRPEKAPNFNLPAGPEVAAAVQARVAAARKPLPDAGSGDHDLPLDPSARAKLQKRKSRKKLAERFVTAPQQVDEALRANQALMFRATGAKYPAIARQLGFSSVEDARLAVVAALADQRAEAADTLRELSNLRLNTAIMAIWKAVEDGDLRAVDRLVQLEKRIAELWGLNIKVPVQVDVSGQGGHGGTTNVSITINPDGSPAERTAALANGPFSWEELRAAYAAIYVERYGTTAPWHLGEMAEFASHVAEHSDPQVIEATARVLPSLPVAPAPGDTLPPAPDAAPDATEPVPEPAFDPLPVADYRPR